MNKVHFGRCLFAAALVAASAPAPSAPLPKPPTGLCADNDCSPVGASGTLKWHPGHYMSLRNRHRDPTKELPQIDAIKNESTLKGALITWKWRDLETAKGVYDFTSIDTYLQRIKSLGTSKRLIIHVYDRAWSNPNSTTVPDYLKADPIYNGGEIPMANGVTALIWEQAVMDRYIELTRALGKRYDSDPNVEGIQFSETAMAFSAQYPAPQSFTNAAHLVQIKRLGAAARDAWPHTNVFISTNYLGSDSQMEDLIKYCLNNRLIVGGPDTWTRAWVDSGKRALQSDEIVNGNRGSGTDYRGQIGIKSEIQSTELGGYIATFTPQEVYDVAYNINKAQYILWDRNDYYGGDEQKWATGILPFIRSVNGASHTACPGSFNGACNTK
jgi:hypothetical protein